VEQHEVLGRDRAVGFQFSPPVAVWQLLAEEKITGPFDAFIQRSLGAALHFFPDGGWQVMHLGGAGFGCGGGLLLPIGVACDAERRQGGGYLVFT